MSSTPGSDIGRIAHNNQATPLTYEQELFQAASPAQQQLQERYSADNYRDTLAAISEDDLLHSGGGLQIFHASHHGEKIIARRTYDNTPQDAKILSRRAAALSLGMGTQGLEQPLAVSLEDQVIFSAKLSGKESSKLLPEEILDIPDSHLTAVSFVFEAALQKGLNFDLTAGNVFYHPEYGFSFTDYHLQDKLQLDLPQRRFASFLCSLSFNPMLATFFDTQQLDAWRSLVQTPSRLFDEVYPDFPEALQEEESRIARMDDQWS